MIKITSTVDFTFCYYMFGVESVIFVKKYNEFHFNKK